MNPYWSNLIVLACLNGIGAWAVGFAMRAGLLSVGHAAFAGLAGYGAGWLYLRGVPLVPAAVFGIAVTVALGLFIAAVTIRLNELFFALATLVFGQFAVVVVSQVDALGGSVGMIGLPFLDLTAFVIAAVAVLLVIELCVIRGSRLEMQLELLEHDPTLVELSGSSPMRLRLLVFGISCAVAGVFGILSALYAGVILPESLGFNGSLFLLVYAVAGGVRSGYGPVIGALVLTVVPKLLGIGGAIETIFLGVLLLVAMLFRSDGLFTRIPVRVLRGALKTSGSAS